MTDTPETNAAEFPCMTWPSRDHPMVVRSEVAKKLERERDEAREKFELMYQTKGDDIYEARKQRDRLAEALEEVYEICLDKTIEIHPDHYLKGTIDECIDISNQALQSLTPNEL
jgi:hypothetical protein